MLPLRLKLTYYYLAIIFIILLGYGVAIYLYLTRSLMTVIDSSLASQIERIENQMMGGSGGDAYTLIDGREVMLQITPHLTQIIDEQGQISDEVLASPRDRLPVDMSMMRRLVMGQTTFLTVVTPAGESMRLGMRRVRALEDRGNYYIRLGQSMEGFRFVRLRLLLILGITVPVIILIGSFGGLLLANQALRPVDRITRTAERIGGGDLTERVPEPASMDEIGRLAATFNQMISRLQAAFDRQKQFTSDASHELRTPLAVMRGDIEITLRRERPISEYQRVLSSTLEEIIRLSGLVEDLLILARADVGRLELECRPTNLTRLCRETTDYIAPLAHHRHQQLTFISSISGDIVLNADANRLKQMLLNLVDNAIKYTDTGGTIDVRLDAGDGEVRLSVRDNGRGIAPEDVARVFDRFFRRSKPLADRTANGSGLGLAIVKWIVEAHGGKIELRSEPGRGTEFLVRLPLLV